jgi:hypothetical protein
MNTTKLTFTIGDWVVSEFESVVEYERFEGGKAKRTVAKRKRDVYGQICGVVRKGVGDYFPASRGHEGDYDPACLVVMEYVLLYEVRQGLVNKPILVNPSDVKRAVGMLDCIPMFKISKPCPWDERAKGFARNELKSWPRDSKGRLLKRSTVGA